MDAHDGWLIFKLPPSEIAAHPTMTPGSNGSHELYLMCDDIRTTVADLRAKGVEFGTDVTDEGFGLLTTIALPGGGGLGRYEPRHKTAYDLT